MNTSTGRLVDLKDIPQNERNQFVPVKRDLTLKEKSDQRIRLYSPCACGSGKKFKFCHYKKP